MASTSSTASRVLDTAERLVQVRGYNGFSYADIAAELQITKASLHYHFATKADLGEALISRYSARFFEALAEVDAGGVAAPAKLAAYAKLYADALSEQKMCLCGMLAAEYPTLPPPMQAAVVGFFDHNEGWLEAVLERGKDEGSLAFAGPARDTARMIVSGLALAFTSAGCKERNAYTEMGGAGDASRLGADWRERIPRDLAALTQT